MFFSAYRVVRQGDAAEEAVRRSLIHIARYPRIQEGILTRDEANRRLYLAAIANGRARILWHERAPSWLPLDEATIPTPALSLEDMVLLRERIAEVGDYFLQSHSVNALTLQLLWEGLDYFEIAHELNITEATVRKRIQRARQELLAYLRDRGEGDE